MATTNGLSNGHVVDEKPQDLAPVSAPHVDDPASLPALKRKHSEMDQSQRPSTQLFADLLELLQKNDPTRSILQLSLPNASQLESSDPPSTKRPRLANHETARTIQARLQDNLYLSLDELEDDIADACETLIDPSKAKEQLKNGQRLSPDEIKNMQHATEFKTFAKALLDRQRQKGTKKPVKKEPSSPADALKANGSKAILSLFGSAPTPRQLFSSLQQTNMSIDGADISLEELGLPNMLSATKVVPLQPTDALGSRKPVPTFADVFPPPASLPTLNPPKLTKASKSSTISWSTGELPKYNRKAGYTLQPLTVGTWVGYGSGESKESSSAIKRRRRESLLNGLDQTKPVEEPSAADIIAQENALFRAAYSSFAPTQDNSKALIAKETKDKVWWHRMGQKRFDKHFVLDPALQEGAFPLELEQSALQVSNQEAISYSEEELKDIEKAIQELDDDAFKPTNLVAVRSINEEEREVDQIMEEISQLLRALSSHQRIRNAYIPTNSRTPASPSPLLSTMIGTATAPSAEETETYKALRSQLAQLISKLPPYAVAKLDGEQFEDLAIKKTIVIQGKEFRGTMEEDQLTRMIRSTTAMQAAANTTSQKADSTPYGRNSSVSNRASSNYYGSRTPATAYARSGTAQSTYNGPSTAPRANYASTFGAQPARPFNGIPTQYNRSQYGAQYGTQTPQQQQPANPARAGYNVPQTAYAPRTNSTFAQPTSSTYTPQNYPQQRPTYAPTNTPSISNSYQQQVQQQQRPQQNYNPQSQIPGRVPTPTFAQPQQQTPNTPSAVGPSGFHSTLTTEQQQLMMERQRAQLAMQPQVRNVAQQQQQQQMTGSPVPLQQQVQQGMHAPQAPIASQMQQQQQPNGQM